MVYIDKMMNFNMRCIWIKVIWTIISRCDRWTLTWDVFESDLGMAVRSNIKDEL